MMAGKNTERRLSKKCRLCVIAIPAKADGENAETESSAPRLSPVNASHVGAMAAQLNGPTVSANQPAGKSSTSE